MYEAVKVEKLGVIDFTLDIKPVSGGRPHINKNGGVYMPKAYTEFKNSIEDIMLQDIGILRVNHYRNKVKKANLFMVAIECGYAVKNERFHNTMKRTRPDIDNVQKPIFDQILGRLGIEDAEIGEVTCRKMYSDHDYITVHVSLFKTDEYKGYNRKTSAEKEKERYKRLDKEIDEKLRIRGIL